MGSTVPQCVPVILLEKVGHGGDGLLVDERVDVGEVLAQDALPQTHQVRVRRELGQGGWQLNGLVFLYRAL